MLLGGGHGYDPQEESFDERAERRAREEKALANDPFLRQAAIPVVTFPKPQGDGTGSGIVRGISNVASGLTTPDNLALMATLGGAPAVVSKAVGIGFAATMAKDVPDKVSAALNARTNGEKAEKMTEAIAEAAMALLSAKHGLGREPIPSADRMASTEAALARARAFNEAGDPASAAGALREATRLALPGPQGEEQMPESSEVGSAPKPPAPATGPLGAPSDLPVMDAESEWVQRQKELAAMVPNDPRRPLIEGRIEQLTEGQQAVPAPSPATETFPPSEQASLRNAGAPDEATATSQPKSADLPPPTVPTHPQAETAFPAPPATEPPWGVSAADMGSTVETKGGVRGKMIGRGTHSFALQPEHGGRMIVVKDADARAVAREAEMAPGSGRGAEPPVAGQTRRREFGEVNAGDVDRQVEHRDGRAGIARKITKGAVIIQPTTGRRFGGKLEDVRVVDAPPERPQSAPPRAAAPADPEQTTRSAEEEFDPPSADLPQNTGGKTAGTLHGRGGVLLPLNSGVKGPSQAVRGRGFPGFNGNQLTHVEGHVAAYMRIHGIKYAVLDINKAPCTKGSGGGCAGLLPKMLPPGARLRVRGPGGYDRIFTGLPD